MKKLWIVAQKRAMSTLASWSRQPTFALRGLTYRQHEQNLSQFRKLLDDEATAKLGLGQAVAAARRLFGRLANLNVRVPGAIESILEDGDELLGRLPDIYAIVSGRGEEDELQRARLVAALWEDFDAQQRAFTPPKPVLVLSVEKVDVGSADFATLLASAQAAQQMEARAEKDWIDVQTALEKLHARLDRDNKRWYGAWTKTYPADTPEGILARLEVPTMPNRHGAQPVDIASLEALADGRVAVTYAEGGGKNAKVLELQWRTAGAEDWSAGVALERPRQVVGPFASGGRMEFRTRAAKSRGRSKWSAVRTVEWKGPVGPSTSPPAARPRS